MRRRGEIKDQREGGVIGTSRRRRWCCTTKQNSLKLGVTIIWHIIPVSWIIQFEGIWFHRFERVF